MTKRPETRSTSIYWLVDMRPETIAAGWHSGRPFYCGKTICTVEARLSGHLKTAQKEPRRALSKMLVDCGEHLRIMTVEVVPPDGDWASRECSWIRTLRFSFPNILNISDGGEGNVGYTASPETKARISHALLNMKPIILTPTERRKWLKTRKPRGKRDLRKVVERRALQRERKLNKQQMSLIS